MRNVLAADLVSNLLGPRGGRDEEMPGNPISEYVTGILAPSGAEVADDESGIRDSELDGDSGKSEDDDADPATAANPVLSPALDPGSMPSSMGMSFCVKSDGEARLDVCATWARYFEAGNVWRREPRCETFSVCGDTVVEFGSDGKRRDGPEAKIRIRAESKREDDITIVNIYMVNCLCPDGGSAKAEQHVFQPQLRISCPAGVELVPMPSSGSGADDEEAELETVYSGRKVMGRGHMTSVVWKDIDPEILEGVDRRGAMRPGFAWVDGDLLLEDERARFSKADIRTEFIPMQPVPAPEMDSWPDGCRKPQLDAKFYSEQYDPDGLRDALEPFNTAYREWVGKLKSIPVDDANVKHRVIQEAESIRQRIADGIDFLCSDDDARLAFCFASRVLYQQSVWHNPEPFKFRPFQLGFILLSARSALDPESPDRGVCDLLWVPTGAGKTEAYLFLVAMTAAYRRLKAQQRHSGDRTGAGVSVISRYTLRLLTIQQFRRTLSLFVAMEYLRVSGMDEGTDVGWRPRGFLDGGDFLWGTTRFSVGLWVGKTVTPNKFGDSGRMGSNPGAKTILQNPSGHDTEPAQVLDCPACGAILSLPADGLMPGRHILHHIIRVTSGGDNTAAVLDNKDLGNVRNAENVSVNAVRNRGQIFALTIEVKTGNNVGHGDLESICNVVKEHAKQHGVDFEYLSASRSRPGYFIKKYDNTEYDFEIFCPNRACPLIRPWAAGSPLGNANGSLEDVLTDVVRGVHSPDGNNFVDINDAFRTEPYMSDRIPIPAFTIDEQVYAQMPTMVVATVDKFARIPFEPKSAHLFGNADHYHHVRGYYRGVEGHPSPKKGRYTEIKRPDRPDLIIQDELHLLDGPLGSMVGIYETAVGHMASRPGRPVKYVASTATIRKADSHVQALLARSLAVFPPKGLSAGDRLFITERRGPVLDEDQPGRLYVGICAPGKGPLTPLIRIWSRLRCSIDEHKEDPHAHHYWTIAGYFNAVRELAGAISLYRQDIPEWIGHLSGARSRQLSPEKSLELSSRTPSSSLPAYLDMLADRNTDTAPEALFATSMFGTGVDVSQLSTMVVNGQPKTSSSYIQATGRVGRSRGAIVVTFHRATRPRDLDHYEQFSKYHLQLHRFVEPPAVFPFSVGIMDHALGPVIVGLLRNKRGCDEWAPEESAVMMGSSSDTAEVRDVAEIVLDHASRQPESRRPEPGDVDSAVKSRIAQWREAASRYGNLRYVEYGDPKNYVVLGDPAHVREDKSPIYDDAPTSMRQVEEEAKFEA